MSADEDPFAQRRLIGLHRAAGCEPAAWAEVCPRDLTVREVEPELGHDQWRGEPRLQGGGAPPGGTTKAGEGEAW
ncbi:MAG: hypothetical protein MUF57_02020 [Gammaproteobacteria bacterium]|jgi:hypothetical protein|nr:hypothetical protein [Gammaproteobacteria bacterium]